MSLASRHLLATAAVLALTACEPAPSSTQAGRDLRDLSREYADSSPSELAVDPGAMAVAEQLFEAHCVACHGRGDDASRSAVDLSRGRFDYGRTVDSVRTTIADGRTSTMPGMGREYGEVELGQLVAYVRTLSSGDELTEYEARGETFFAESCAVCHGPEGRGIEALGAPNLADDYWQHGDSMMNIRLVITRGVESSCPGYADLLSPTEVELLTSYTLGLGAATDHSLDLQESAVSGPGVGY